MKHPNYSEPGNINVYMQQMLRPISKRYIYSSYVNSLPIKTNDKILEFGSGIGVMAELFARKLNDGQLTCIDVSNRYLSVAQRNLKAFQNVSFQKGRLFNLNYSDDLYDAIYVHFVLHDVAQSDRSKIVEQMYKVLRPGGKVYVREPLRKSHGMPVSEIQMLFEKAGFYSLYEEEKKVKIFGDLFTACYAKISTMSFFLS